METITARDSALKNLSLVLASGFWTTQPTDWMSDGSSNLLWLTAGPGYGKTMLSSFLVDELVRTEPDGIICSFFFSKGDENRSHAGPALCALLHQAFTATPLSVRLAVGDFETQDFDTFQNALGQLWGKVTEVASQSADRKTICVLDALDECSESSRNRLIKLLSSSFSANKPARESSNLKVLLTSRPLPYIEEGFATSNVLRLRRGDETESFSKDLEASIRHKVGELKQKSSLSPEACDLVQETLLKRADRTFLWVALVLDSISNLHSRNLRNIRKVLDEVPSKLEDLYEQALGSFSNPAESRRLLEYSWPRESHSLSMR